MISFVNRGAIAMDEWLPENTRRTFRSCKVCGAPSALFGVVDFNKHCDEERTGKLPVSGQPVYYYRCLDCGFLFTGLCDGWTESDFGERIYNQAYHLIDSDYATVRPDSNAGIIADLLDPVRDRLRMLDFWGGNGRLAARLRKAGFPDCETYDPHDPAHAAKPTRRFNLITSFETLEHSPDPSRFVQEVAALLEDTGLVLFSTMVQPEDIGAIGLSWWYAGPRNGHISESPHQR